MDASTVCGMNLLAPHGPPVPSALAALPAGTGTALLVVPAKWAPVRAVAEDLVGEEFTTHPTPTPSARRRFS